MKYKNVKTGAVIETFGKISGGDWQEVITAAVENKAKGGESALAEAVESCEEPDEICVQICRTKDQEKIGGDE